VLAAALSALLTATSLYGPPQLLFRFADPAIDESSGLAASSTAPGALWTHNDSGDKPRFFAVGPDGRTRTTFTVPGVDVRDWEDMARGPDEQGRSCLWFGDIGDNDARRDQGVLLRRVREPELDGRAQRRTGPSVDFRLVYPDGPGDAETLMVQPRTGRVFLVSKPLAGTARVYAAPERLDPDGVNRLEEVGEFAPRLTGTPGGPDIGSLAQVLVTGGDFSPDGTRFVLRTYTDAYEFTVAGGDVAAALTADPTVIPLPQTQQGEGITYSPDGSALLVSSEGEDAPVYRLAGRPGAVASPSPERAAQGATPVSGTRERSAVPAVVAGAGVALAVLLAGWLAVRPGRSRGRRAR